MMRGILPLGLLAVAMIWPQNNATVLHLHEGQNTTVSGTNITIQAVKVRDYTSQGCEGGPQGCPDQAELTIRQSTNRQSVTLFVAHTRSQSAKGISMKSAFGYEIVLVSVHVKEVTLSVQKAADPNYKPNRKQ